MKNWKPWIVAAIVGAVILYIAMKERKRNNTPIPGDEEEIVASETDLEETAETTAAEHLGEDIYGSGDSRYPKPKPGIPGIIIPDIISNVFAPNK